MNLNELLILRPVKRRGGELQDAVLILESFRNWDISLSGIFVMVYLSLQSGMLTMVKEYNLSSLAFRQSGSHQRRM